MAIRDVAAQVAQRDAVLTLVFVSPTYDLDPVGREIAAGFPGDVLACTTAGALDTMGYANATIGGVSVASPDLQVHTEFIPSLAAFARSGQLTAPPLAAEGARRFGIALLDGLSMLEDPVIAMLQACCDGIPIVGGSAGDDLRFAASHVYHDGAFHEGAGALAIVDTTLPFSTFMVQHFEPTQAKLVITAAAPATRCVFEINGAPAATEYARIIGVPRRDLSPAVFAANPVMLRVGGRYYVRSIQRVNPDDSLTFYCAIDTGLVLTLASPTDLVGALERSLAEVNETVPNMALLLAFDCVLRRLEVEHAGQEQALATVLVDYPITGFSTYGEQYNGLHMNHTLTGLALGGRS